MQDKYGNGINTNFSFNVSINYPEIIYTNIKDGEENVELHSTLQLTFSHEMNRKAIEKNLSIEPECNHDIIWNDSTLLINLQLEYGKTYYVNISKNATDILGIPMKENFSIHFSTLKEIERYTEEKEMPSFMLFAVLLAILLVARRKLK